MEIRYLQETQKALSETAGFLNYVMQKKHFSAEYLQWQYIDNPVGKAIAVSAYEGDKIVGHYAAQPIISKINGTETHGLFILNAAVEPVNQGKGLLRSIADHLHAEAAVQGFGFMIGVGNKNSTPIYTKKFGFRSIGSIDVKLGIGLPKTEINQKYNYERLWNAETLKWRISNPVCKYKIIAKEDQIALYRRYYPFLSSIMGIFDRSVLKGDADRKSPYGFNLYLGIDPGIIWAQNRHFINFPEIAKPSPLVVIFKELSDFQVPLTKENMLFRGIDFDAF